MRTPPINESAELIRGALQLILYSEVTPHPPFTTTCQMIRALMLKDDVNVALLFIIYFM
jgi:hypothetical protein